MPVPEDTIESLLDEFSAPTEDKILLAQEQVDISKLSDIKYDGNFVGTDHLLAEDYNIPMYYVNLDRSVARREQMDSLFDDLKTRGHQIFSKRVPAKNMEFVETLIREGHFIANGYEIVPTDEEESWMKHQKNQYSTIEVACLLSHLYAVLQAYQDGHQAVLILEDDVILKEEFLKDWKEYAKEAPSDWKILQWANSNDAVLKHTANYNSDRWITWQPEYYGALAYMVTREGMEEILKKSLKQSEEGVFVWHLDCEQVVVADEVVYWLAGSAYTSTYPWFSTSGLDSTFGGSHEVFSSEEYIYKQKHRLASEEAVLVLQNCRLTDETQIMEEIKRIRVDSEVFSKWNSNFRIVVNAVITQENLLPFFEEQVSTLDNPSLEIRSRVDSKAFNKFLFVAEMIDEMPRFDSVLIKDSGMRFAGFAWHAFMDAKRDAIVVGALQQSIEESLARSLGKPKRQYYEFHEGQMWKYNSVAEYTSLTPIPTLFIEHGFALLKSEFAVWFFEQVLEKEFLSQQSDWGIDKMWCAAAKDFGPDSEHCLLIPIPITHDDTSQFPVTGDSEKLGMDVMANFRQTDIFNGWMNSIQSWEEFIGDNSSLTEVLSRCRAFLYEGKPITYDLSECAKRIAIEGETNMPGNLYACGWDDLALQIFPDMTYRGSFRENVHIYHERDVVVADYFSGCLPTEHGQRSMEKMLQLFPGKMILVNGESHGNMHEYPTVLNDQIFQMGPWSENDYSNSIQVYLAAMVLSAVGDEKWPWIYDPAQRQLNNGKHHAIAYFVSNCMEFRHNAAKALSDVVEVHYGGKCSVDSPNARKVEAEHYHWSENWKLFRDYKYCLVFENKAQSGYITEKIMMAFLGGCMPIYFGTSEIFDLFNQESFIFYDPENPELALAKMRNFEEDPEAYATALSHPILRDGANTIRRYFSLGDGIILGDGTPVEPELKSRIRHMMGVGYDQIY